MGIGTSLLLIAVGAILKFAVTASVSGLELATIGVILMVVGVIGLLISLFLLTQRSEPTVATIADGILKQDFEPKPSPEICSFCDYRIVCPAAEK